MTASITNAHAAPETTRLFYGKSPGITAYLASTNHNRTANRGKIEPRIEPH